MYIIGSKFQDVQELGLTLSVKDSAWWLIGFNFKKFA